MSDIVDTVKMPDQDGKSPGDLWYGLPINPTLATHVWNGREWRPLLTEEDYYRAEITALRAEIEKFKMSLSDVVQQTQEQADTITALRAEVDRLTDVIAQLQEIVNSDTAEEERIRAENERLRAALQAWDDAVVITVTAEGPVFISMSRELAKKAWITARAALEEKP